MTLDCNRRLLESASPWVNDSLSPHLVIPSLQCQAPVEPNIDRHRPIHRGTSSASSDSLIVAEGWAGAPAPTDSTVIHRQLLGEGSQATNVMTEGLHDGLAPSSTLSVQVGLRQGEVALQAHEMAERSFGWTFRSRRRELDHTVGKWPAGDHGR